MRGAEQFEINDLTLFGEERIAGGAQVRLRSSTLPCAQTQHTRDTERGAKRRHEERIFRGSFAADTMIEMEDTQARSQGFVRPERAKQID